MFQLPSGRISGERFRAGSKSTSMTSAFQPSPELQTDLRRLFMRSLGAGVVLSLISCVGGFFDPGNFFRSYLMGYLFWLGVALGALGIVMMQYLTAGA